MKLKASIPILAAAALLFMVGCSDGSSFEGTWQSSESENESELVIESDGTFNGTDGCNRLSGSWEESEDAISFHEVVTTQMACLEDDGIWLSQLDTAEISEDTLHVFDESGTEVGTLER